MRCAWKIISQKDKPIAFNSITLTDAPKWYTVTEIELLSTVETLKEIRTILTCQKLIKYTDHKNLTCRNYNTDIVLIWRLIPEEYGPDREYIKGGKNTAADALSRLPLNGNQKTTQKSTYQKEIVSEINTIK